VTTAYTGLQGALTMNAISQFNSYPTIKADSSLLNYGPVINAKIAGSRVITPSSVTGQQSGDSGLSVSEAVWFTGQQPAGPSFSANVSGESSAVWPTITIEITTDQGVVSP